ncbi:MAG: hypothetical protein WDM78_16100 [Puia sp.]
MQPISPIALILWHYQQGSQLSAEERKQLLHWTDQSEDRRRFLNDLIYQKKWVELTLMQFLNEFNDTITQIKSDFGTFQHAR